jgi:hypothetical protein
VWFLALVSASSTCDEHGGNKVVTNYYNDNAQEFCTSFPSITILSFSSLRFLLKDGVNAQGRLYVQALRHPSTRSRPDTLGDYHNECVNIDSILNNPLVPEHLSSPSLEPSAIPGPVLRAPEAEPATVNLPTQPTTATVLRALHSKVTYAAQSFGAGDVSVMPPQAAAHFIAAFELMDQEDAAEDGVLRDSLRGSKKLYAHRRW